ncbi:MAG: AAA family ATPase [Armatimonadetes bacterium]|nr:AAA family ATPase [Armatimonadota bacterium]
MSTTDPFADDDAPETPRERKQPDDGARAARLVNEIIRATPRSDPRLPELFVLRKLIDTQSKRLQDAENQNEEFEEAYHRLTAPANRLGVYLGPAGDDTALVAIGDQEYVASLSPEVQLQGLDVGARVKVNEAFAVVGELGYHPGGTLAKVSEIVGEEMIRIGADPQGSQSRVIHRSSKLKETPLRSGDEVRVEPNLKVAIEHFPTKDIQEYFLEEVPEIPWSQIGGQEQVISVIKDAIELPLIHPELYTRFEKRPLKGILLYGPPGCGKTLIGKATAYNLTREYRERTGRDVKEYFMYINGPKILNMWLGETERMVREIFQTARAKAKDGYLVFIFVDEAESVLRTRSSGRWLNISNTVVPQFCAEMDGLVTLDNVVVIITSNRPDYIDPAILRPERIDRKVKVGRPDRADTRSIFGIYLHPAIPLDPDLVREHKGDESAARDEMLDLTVEYLWRRNEETSFLEVFTRSGGVETLHWRDLVSGALVRSVVERAKDLAIRRSIERMSATEGVTLEDLRQAIRLEYKENEIFPKSDAQEDWLKLIDYEPENVATVRPIRAEKVRSSSSRDII